MCRKRANIFFPVSLEREEWICLCYIVLYYITYTINNIVFIIVIIGFYMIMYEVRTKMKFCSVLLQCPDSGAIQSYCSGESNRARREAEEACSFMRSSIFRDCHKLVSGFYLHGFRMPLNASLINTSRDNLLFVGINC